jgi:hypothetical protein
MVLPTSLLIHLIIVISLCVNVLLAHYMTIYCAAQWFSHALHNDLPCVAAIAMRNGIAIDLAADLLA